MSLTTYNFLWGMVKFILPNYLERRQKKGKEDIHRINERFGISKNNRPDGTLVWLHGTSVGESVAALALANSMSKNGYGTITFQNGEVYEGEFKIGDQVLNFQRDNLAIKIDVEGHELNVLKGIQNLLRSNKCIIQIEIFEKNFDSVNSYLLENNFTLVEHFKQRSNYFYFNY